MGGIYTLRGGPTLKAALMYYKAGDHEAEHYVILVRHCLGGFYVT